jgi:hypothetical protein
LIDGKLTIGGDANWTASLNMSVAGLFCDRANLETQDQKRAAIQAILDRTLPGATLGDFSVTALSSLDSDAPADVDSGVKAAKGTNSMLTVTADVRGAGPLPELDGGRVLTLPQDGPWTSQISIPLGRTERKSDLRIAQAFTSSLQLEIAWPAQWHATAQPREYSSAKLKWGQARQTVSGKSDSLRIDQKLDVKARDIAHVDYASLREAISALQAPASRTLILRPAGP